MKSNLYDLEVMVHHQTDKAWLVSNDGERKNAVWIPKSQGEMEQKLTSGLHPVWILTAPEPLLIEKGLV
jgi:hypothetical protein